MRIGDGDWQILKYVPGEPFRVRRLDSSEFNGRYARQVALRKAHELSKACPLDIFFVVESWVCQTEFASVMRRAALYQGGTGKLSRDALESAYSVVVKGV